MYALGALSSLKVFGKSVPSATHDCRRGCPLTASATHKDPWTTSICVSMRGMGACSINSATKPRRTWISARAAQCQAGADQFRQTNAPRRFGGKTNSKQTVSAETTAFPFDTLHDTCKILLQVSSSHDVHTGGSDDSKSCFHSMHRRV